MRRWAASASSSAATSLPVRPRSATGSASRTGGAALRRRPWAPSPSTPSRRSISAVCRPVSSSGMRPPCASWKRRATRSRRAIEGTSRRTARRSTGSSTRSCARRDGTMPELPDVTVYVEALRERVVGARLEGLRLATPFVLRSVDPPLGDVVGRAVTGVRRLGKRIVLALEAERFVVVHLMIAGRMHWKAAGARPPGRIGVAAFDFTTGTLVMTEAGTKRRAAIHLVRGEAALAEHDPGGREPLTAGLEEFRAALTAESHTLKRALTDPTIFSGIGNAYGDEILHRARLSPVKLTG